MLTVSLASDNPHWLEQLSWLSQIILVMFAALTLWFGYRQLVDAAATRAQELRIAQATLLLELDARWDSPETKNARHLIGQLIDQTKQVVSAKHPLANDAAKQALLEQEWASQLQALRVEAEDEYLQLLGICGFFETVGLMVEKNYISEADVLSLFKGPLVDMDTAFRRHFTDRSKEMGVPNGLFEHALNLGAIARNAG